jgi:uncharacterized protein (DUF2164 family)
MIKRVVVFTLGFGIIFASVILIFFMGTIFFLRSSYLQTTEKSVKENYDLSTLQGREQASLSKDVSPYKVKKCGILKHTDNKDLTFCLADFDGTTSGFYDPDKELMVVGSYDAYVLVHEITHATTYHFYKEGYKDIEGSATQEKMAYNAENLLHQMVDFRDNMDITQDLTYAEKVRAGLSLESLKVDPVSASK